MESRLIRQNFIDFFTKKQHLIVPSAPIVLKDDPTLMFTNSGMNQFKDSFLGYKKPESLRIADTQKCLRVSGKHNDLDDVGKDTYHHTMFEMLGNWSFGDYFKEEAIDWAWELLTEVYKIPKEWLYVTVFEGYDKDGLEKDEEAYRYWKKHLPEDRILNGSKKDNFWEMGATGPCGPCSEIHIDIRSIEDKEKVDGKQLVNQDHPQVIEIWNLVFMEFLRKDDGSLEKLPHKNIDTGMGFERLCMVLQGKTSNYDTDVFTPLIKKVEEISGVSYGNNKDTDIAIRVVVDHFRAAAFAIADGQLPSNTGGGYVIRRILRRAISYAYRFLDQKDPFIYNLLPVLIKQMGSFFPEIEKQKTLIEEVIKEEENSFLKTIEHGLIKLNDLINSCKETHILPGKELFTLYDTYGFPLDLSRIIAEEKGYTVDEDGFSAEMKKQKERAKNAGKQNFYDWKILIDNKEDSFIGYDTLSTSTHITRFREIENHKGKFFQIVLNQTPFYAESGGQVGDTGKLISSTGQIIDVIDTIKENNLTIHLTKELPADLSAKITAEVDIKRRESVMKNHTATHLLHQALREKLGTHVEQKGSYVGSNNLRFDFSHYQKMTDDELKWVENFVNNKIKDAFSLIENRSEDIAKATERGAMALFGEKYGKKVRTIQFGDSIELCGGTHVKNTQDIQWFKLLNEGSSAAGIRRIEAITGDSVKSYYEGIENQFNNMLSLLKNPAEPKAYIEKILSELSKVKKENEALQKLQAKNEKQLWKEALKEINNINYIAVETSLDPSIIKDLAFQLKHEIPSLFLVVGSTAQNKPSIAVCISDDLLKSAHLHAGKIVQELAKEIEGSGGGQASFATAGGKKIDGIKQALEKSRNYL